MKLNSNIDFSGTSDIVLRKTESVQTTTTSKLTKLGGIYEEHSKLVFLFDVSGSMSSLVSRDKGGKSCVDSYTWTPELLAQIRQRVATVAGMDPMVLLLGGDSVDVKLAGLAVAKDDEELKRLVVELDLIGELGVPVNWAKHNAKPPQRIELVKKLAKSELQARFAKYPDSRVCVIPFGSQPVVAFDDGAADQLWPLLDRLSTCMDGTGGGTDIMRAIRAGVEACRKHPSMVGVHHFIVVSDGEDGGTREIGGWVPSLKASGIVLDYIHIGDSTVNEELRDACKALGGECVTVNTESEFESRFVEATRRLCLPQPATV